MPRKKTTKAAEEVKETKAVETPEAKAAETKEPTKEEKPAAAPAKETKEAVKEDKPVEASAKEAESKSTNRAWLQTVGKMVRETKANNGRVAIGIGLMNDKGEKTLGRTFVSKGSVHEGQYAESNKSLPDDKKKYLVVLTANKDYDFVTGKGDNRQTVKMKGSEISAQNKAYNQSMMNARKEMSNPEADKDVSKEAEGPEVG